MSTNGAKDIQFFVNEKAGAVSGLLIKPSDARGLLLLAHGAGAGMRHRFMEDLAAKLAQRGVATLRYQFPYMEKRTKRPDSEGVLTDTVRAAVTAAKKQAGDLPLFAGGKSMGGRMTSLAAATSAAGRRARLDFFRIPAACRRPARRGARPASRGCDSAVAFSPGLARCAGGAEASQAALRKARQTRRIVHRQRRRSFVPYAQERRKVG